MTVRLFMIAMIVLLAAPEGEAYKSESPCFMPAPLVILTPACAGQKDSPERCKVLKAVADGARAGALAAIEGRDMIVLTRNEAGAALARYGLPAPCPDQVTCALESTRRINGGYVITGTVTASGPARKRSWKITLQLHKAGTRKLVGQSATLNLRADAGIGDEVQSLAEKLVRPAVEPELFRRRSSDPANARAEDVLVTFEAPAGGIVRVDGKLACVRTPCARRLATGEHEATFEQVNLAPATVKFTAKKGGKVRADLAYAGDRPRLAVLFPQWLPCPARPAEFKFDRCWALGALAKVAPVGVREALAGRDAEVIETQGAESEIDRRGVIPSCGGQRNCALETARLIGAEFVLTGDVTGPQTRLVITLELRDVKSGKLLIRRNKPLELPEDGRSSGLSGMANRLMTEALELKQVAGRFPLSEVPNNKRVLVGFGSGPETGAAAVSVDNRLACWTPCNVFLTPGEHQAAFEQLRFEPATVQFVAGRDKAVKGAPAPDFGWIGIESDLNQLDIAAVVDDGRKEDWTMDLAGVRWREVDAGEVEVVLAAADACFLPVRERVNVKAGERRLVKMTPKPRIAPLEVKAMEETGREVAARVKLDGRDIGATGTRLEVPLCYFDSISRRGDRGRGRVVSVPFEHDIFAAEVTLKEGETNRVTASPVPLVPAGRMALLPGGTFTLADTNREVTVAPFLLDVTEVTAREFQNCVRAGDCDEPEREREHGWDPIGMRGFMGQKVYKPGEGCTYRAPGKELHPANCVTWDQASAYCAWKNKRLPTEEEWEWAARGRLETYQPWGDPGGEGYACRGTAGMAALKTARGFLQTCRVGAYPSDSNPEGIRDLAGNVSEWTSSAWTSDPAQDERTARELRIPYREKRVIRGSPWESRSGGRNWQFPTRWFNEVGFRCARTP